VYVSLFSLLLDPLIGLEGSSLSTEEIYLHNNCLQNVWSNLNGTFINLVLKVGQSEDLSGYIYPYVIIIYKTIS